MPGIVWLVVGLAVVGIVFIQLPRLFSAGAMAVRVERALTEERRLRRPAANRLHAYHVAVEGGRAPTPVEERTWRDLDLEEVFARVDYTASRPGQQYLYHLLRTPRFTAPPLEEFGAGVRAFAASPALAEQCRAALTGVDDPRAANIVELAYGDLPSRPGFWWIFPIMTMASLACIASMVVWPKALVLLAVMCLANIATQMRFKRRMDVVIPAIHQIPPFMKAARQLGKIAINGCTEQVAALRDGEKTSHVLRRATKWLSFEPSQSSNEFKSMLYAYANLLMLIDVNAFVLAIGAARATRPQLQAMLAAMGHIDAAQSIAQWRATQPKWSEPSFTEPAKALSVTDIVHPLLDTPVGNSLSVNGTSVLLTGSNMSGKTTFVRTLGVNAVLAQTIYTVCGTSWNAPFLHVGASIGRADNLLEGRSYYLAEVESIRELIRAKADGHQNLFLLDEIYRGTNTEERVAAAYAVLEHLHQGLDIVIVATHDIELLKLLDNSYAPYHFREEINGRELTFDYTMRPGQATTRNAIALLELMEYPADVVAAARRALGDANG